MLFPLRIGNDMKLEFIIPTYKRINNLCTLLYSLKSQTSNDWTAQVISDNTPEEIIRPVINHFSEDSRINFNVLSKRYNDWGHTPRNVGLNHSKEELLVMTGEDNYYVPTFVKEILKEYKKSSSDIILCDMIHDMSGEYVLVPALPYHSHINMGNCVYCKESIKNQRLEVFRHDADWHFFNTAINKGLKYTIIRKVLYVHN